MKDINPIISADELITLIVEITGVAGWLMEVLQKKAEEVGDTTWKSTLRLEQMRETLRAVDHVPGIDRIAAECLKEAAEIIEHRLFLKEEQDEKNKY